MVLMLVSLFFFFNDTATTEIYTLSLHDALPISVAFSLCFTVVVSTILLLLRISRKASRRAVSNSGPIRKFWRVESIDRKSTRLNSSHLVISYAVFCLKKKNNHKTQSPPTRHIAD